MGVIDASTSAEEHFKKILPRRLSKMGKVQRRCIKIETEAFTRTKYSSLYW
jgi:hypothetical protein